MKVAHFNVPAEFVAFLRLVTAYFSTIWRQVIATCPSWETGEKEMNNMIPDADSTLGYLKCRWACESVLCPAAQRGIPLSSFRSSICTPSPFSGATLSRTDSNRRILEGNLQTGLVPDFAIDRRGGMV